MKMRNKVFTFVLLMAAVQTALCDADGSETDSICQRPGHDEFANVFKIGNECVEKDVALFGVGMYQNNQSLERYREVFRDFCTNQQTVRECLAEKTTELETCNMEDQVKVFMIFRGILERILNVECGDGSQGENLATLFQGLVSLARVPSFAELDQCISETSAVVKDALRTFNDTSSKLFIIHSQISAFKRCLRGNEMRKELGEAMVFILNEMITGMKCVHPKDGTLVLCSSIDSTLISSCLVHLPKRVLFPYDALEREEALCYDFLMTRDRWDVDITDDLQKLHSDTRTLCRVAHESVNCVGQQKSHHADLCLSDVQRREYDLLVDFSKKAYRYVCFEKVNSLVEIMFIVYRIRRFGEGHAVWDCMELAKSTRNATDASSGTSTSKNMRLYREMLATKPCLVDKLQANSHIADSIAATMIDKLLGMIKCVHPGDGTTVLCETLVDGA